MSKSLALLELGFHIFPCNADKHPLTEHGHIDASNDRSQVELWDKAFPNALWGVHAGRSGIVVLDVDVKNGDDGFLSIGDNWLEIPETFNYQTATGGTHYVYADDGTVPLSGISKYRKMAGVDRRGGSSYIIWWGDVPAKGTVFTAPPAWLLDPATTHTGAEFLGQLDDWISQLEPGEPTDKVIEAIDRIPDADFSHSDMVSRQMEFIRLGAERHSGVLDGLNILKEYWLNRDPAKHSTPFADWSFKFDEALYSGISKYGATSSLLNNLPDYQSVIDKLPKSFNLDMVYGQEKHKSHYHNLLNELIATDLTADEIVSVMWNSPTVKKWTVEWGEGYLLKEIKSKRDNLIDEDKPRALPAQVVVEKSKFLTKDERERLQRYHTWIDVYLDWVRERLPVVNEEYHIMQALTILESVYAPIAYYDADDGFIPLTLFKMALGESSTGKSISVNLRDKVLNEIYANDRGYDIGSNVSNSYLHAKLIERDGKWSLISDDEIAAFFKVILDPRAGTWNNSLDTFLTKVYGGYVAPMGRSGNKDVSGKSAKTYTTATFLGTPEKVFSLLTADNFEDGFLARFLWFFGAPPVESSEIIPRRLVRDDKGVEEYDVDARRLAMSLLSAYEVLEGGKMRVTDEASLRFGLFDLHLRQEIAGHDNANILVPSTRRLGDSVVKIAALFALSEGSMTVNERFALQAIQLGELLFNNAVTASYRVSKSVFQRKLDEVYDYLYNKGGVMRKQALAKVFAGKLHREYRLVMETLVEQGLVIHANIKSDEAWAIKKGD